MLQERVVSREMDPVTSDTENRIRFWMSTPIRTSCRQRSRTHRIDRYQSHRLPRPTDHWQQVMVIPRVAILAVVLQVCWRIARILVMKMMKKTWVRMRTIHRWWSTNPRGPLSHRNLQASTGISGVNGKHLRALIGEEAGLFIAVGGAVDWRSSAEADWPVQAGALDIVLRIRCDFGDRILSFLFLGIIIVSEEHWAWLIAWEELGTVHQMVSSMVQVYGRHTALEQCTPDFECGHHVELELSSGATFTLLVYVSNRWIDNSIYASPIWQLHDKSTYASLCARIGPKGSSIDSRMHNSKGLTRGRDWWWRWTQWWPRRSRRQRLPDGQWYSWSPFPNHWWGSSIHGDPEPLNAGNATRNSRAVGSRTETTTSNVRGRARQNGCQMRSLGWQTHWTRLTKHRRPKTKYLQDRSPVQYCSGAKRLDQCLDTLHSNIDSHSDHFQCCRPDQVNYVIALLYAWSNHHNWALRQTAMSDPSEWAGDWSVHSGPCLQGFDLGKQEMAKAYWDKNWHRVAVIMPMQEYIQHRQGSVRAYANRVKANWRQAGWNLQKHEDVLYDIGWAGIRNSLKNKVGPMTPDCGQFDTFDEFSIRPQPRKLHLFNTRIHSRSNNSSSNSLQACLLQAANEATGHEC